MLDNHTENTHYLLKWNLTISSEYLIGIRKGSCLNARGMCSESAIEMF